MSLLNRFRQKKTEGEAERVARLLRTGRIAEGTIFDISDDGQDNAAQVFYSYSINGVDYESSQLLTDEQHSQKSNYTPGARIIVRYDPRQPGNSVVV
jgi:hypothetical protein